LGIEAPREVRVVRGELPALTSESDHGTADAVAEFTLEFEASDASERPSPMRVIGQSNPASHGNAVRPEKSSVSAFKVIRDESDLKTAESRKELALENRVQEILARMSKTPR
jgi:hypothetical protein